MSMKKVSRELSRIRSEFDVAKGRSGHCHRQVQLPLVPLRNGH